MEFGFFGHDPSHPFTVSTFNRLSFVLVAALPPPTPPDWRDCLEVVLHLVSKEGPGTESSLWVEELKVVYMFYVTVWYYVFGHSLIFLKIWLILFIYFHCTREGEGEGEGDGEAESCQAQDSNRGQPWGKSSQPPLHLPAPRITFYKMPCFLSYCSWVKEVVFKSLQFE